MAPGHKPAEESEVSLRLSVRLSDEFAAEAHRTADDVPERRFPRCTNYLSHRGEVLSQNSFYRELLAFALMYLDVEDRDRHNGYTFGW